ncbi:unnamed protein product [Brassica napus]|uniref:RNA-dependent RNA polymerase n=1 Tax=Brassica napus TaxID=3708 RepID=A0A816JPB9_BRANA|nr:unnamed protein product [Brassica napus]
MGKALNHGKTEHIWFCAPCILLPTCVLLCSKLSATTSATVNIACNFLIHLETSRLRQSLGSSKETLTVIAYDVELIPDVEIFSSGTRYVFSDGIGNISSEFAELVARKCDIKGVSPSAFQIRCGWYKGVVDQDPI